MSQKRVLELIRGAGSDCPVASTFFDIESAKGVVDGALGPSLLPKEGDEEFVRSTLVLAMP